MKVSLKILTFLIIGFFFQNCKTQSTKTIHKDGKCKLPDLTWLKVVDGYDAKTTLDLATKFEAAAKADFEKFKALGKADANAAVNFATNFTKIANQSSTRTYEVSQDFYEAYRAKRDAICGMFLFLDRKDISSSSREKAENLLLNTQESWADIKDKEQKKISSQ